MIFNEFHIMIFKYIFISLIFGFVLGILLMFICCKKFIKSYYIKYEIKQTQKEVNNYRKELNNYFFHCAELFNIISKDCNKLYEYMVQESKKFLPQQITENKNLICKIEEIEKIFEKNIQVPRDYSDNSSKTK